MRRAQDIYWMAAITLFHVERFGNAAQCGNLFHVEQSLKTQIGRNVN